MAGIILGMGMPTTPAYIVMVALLVPAVIKLGVRPPAGARAAHMFAFYFAILSAITPPVALAVFAAASLAKANMWAVGLRTPCASAAPAYIVPFMFVYEPALLIVNGLGRELARHVCLRSVSAIARRASCLAAGLFGWLVGACAAVGARGAGPRRAAA